MSLHTDDGDLRIYNGDALDVLRQLPSHSVDCCVTSPPYWGLRDYGSEGQLGLEATPEAYVAAMVAVFAEVRRVLSDSGTVWLNLGDSYTSIGRTGRKESPGVGAKQGMGRVERDVVWAPREEGDPDAHFRWTLPGGQKPKDLVGIPWRVAFALQADGWYLRSDIVWSKSNPMPESVTDRPTKAHEYVFLLAKQPKYFYDNDAIREPHADFRTGRNGPAHGYDKGKDQAAKAVGARAETKWNPRENNYNPAGRNVRSVWEIATQPYAQAHFATYPEELVRRCLLAGCPEGGTVLDPFGGSGTTGLVARKHGRRAVLIELSAAYCDLAARRCQQLSLFAEASKEAV